MIGYHFWIAVAALVSSSPPSVRYPEVSPVAISAAWSYFTTADAPERVVSHFAESWRELGVPVAVDRHRSGSAVVSAFFTRERLQRAVVVMQTPSGTLAFQLERSIEGMLAFAVNEGMDLQRPPIPPDSGLWPLPIDQARAHWEATLAAAGYRPMDGAWTNGGGGDSSSRRQLTLRHQSEGREIWTQLVEVQPGVTAWIALPMGGAVILEARKP